MFSHCPLPQSRSVSVRLVAPCWPPPNRTAQISRLALCSPADARRLSHCMQGEHRASGDPFFLLSPLLSGDKSDTFERFSNSVGTSPGIFSLSSERLSLIPIFPKTSPTFVSLALLQFFPCASIRPVRRPDQGRFIGPSPPPHGDPGAKATFSSLSFNLPGAGPRPISSGRTSPYGGLHEELSHQGHSKRWHCRPRRHRQDPTGVVVALHRGYDPALGKNCGRQHHDRLGRRRNHAKDFHSNGPCVRRMVSDSDWPLRLVRESQN